MRTKITLLGFLAGLLFSTLEAQKAPDFTVTDFNSKTHKLYADYLDKDKVIVIKFFFIGCPPCASVAPYVQSAYTRWGSGSGNVEFLQMTTLSSDKNASVKSYHQSKGLTFPGIGSDGNSAQAVAPYKSGTFGTWYGTPTFVVIAPNGDVDYNVNMSAGNPYGLDTAIARAFRKVNGGGGGGTGCANAFSVKTITSIQPEAYLVVDYLNGNPAIRMDSGTYNCEFSLPQNLDGIYVQPVISRKDNPVNGVTTGDIVKIQRHILKLDTLNNLQQRVADVNNSSSVSAADVSEIRKLVLGVTSGFSKLTESFVVVHNPRSKNIFDMDNKVLLKSLVDKSKINEFGIGKFGDVTGSNLLAGNKTVNRNSSDVEVEVKAQKLDQGQYKYSFYIKNVRQLEAFQFSLNIQNCQIYRIISGQHEHTSFEMDYSMQTETGEIRVIGWKNGNFASDWNQNSAVLNVITNAPTAFIKLQNSDFPIEFVVSDQEVYSNYKFHLVNKELHSVFYYESGTKSIELNASFKLKAFEIFNLQGLLVKSDFFSEFDQSETLTIHTDSFNSGIYFIRLFSIDGASMVKQIWIP